MPEVPMMVSLGCLPMTPVPSRAPASCLLSKVGLGLLALLAAVAVFVVVKRRSSSDVNEIDEEDGFDGVWSG